MDESLEAKIRAYWSDLTPEGRVLIGKCLIATLLVFRLDEGAGAELTEYVTVLAERLKSAGRP